MSGFGKFLLIWSTSAVYVQTFASDNFCPQFGPVRHADVITSTEPPYKVGTTVRVQCDKGFIGHGSPKVTCLEDGRWSGKIPYCTASQCRRDISQIEKDRKCRKPCKTRNDCKGQLKKCECDNWCGMSCFNPYADCPALKAPENGYILGTKYSYGYGVSYGCSKGFTLSGDATRSCRSDRTWSGHEPKCLRFSVCGIPGDEEESDISGKVIHGNDAKKGAWPWQALLFYNANHHVAQIYNPRQGFGGGSIIDNKWILTAAHVFDDFLQLNQNVSWKAEFLIALGMASYPKVDHVIPDHVYIFEPHEVYRHNKYDGKIYDHDVALIRIGKRLKRTGNKFVIDSNAPDRVMQFSRYIRPICLPCMNDDSLHQDMDILKNFDKKKCHSRDRSSTRDYVRAGSNVMVTGFGWKRDPGSSLQYRPRRLQEGAVTIQDDSVCVEGVQRKNTDARYTDRMICAKSANESLATDSCHGDSGGPLAIEIHTGGQPKYWMQVGIVSWGFDCGSDFPGYYTSVASIMPWIWDTINSNSEKNIEFKFTEWTEWTQCSVTCGDGESSKSRKCVGEDGSIVPDEKACDDPRRLGTFQTRQCTAGICYSFSPWTNWSECNATCGIGQTARTRKCVWSLDSFGVFESPDTNLCPDPERHGTVQAKLCTTGSCHSWSDWNGWSDCDVSCGSGLSVRRRICATESGSIVSATKRCPDPEGLGTQQERICTPGLCYSFTDWTRWSVCSVSCGKGVTERTRACVAKDASIAPNINLCSDPQRHGIRQARLCTAGLCSSFTDWTPWSTCTVSCGNGVTLRARACVAENGSIAQNINRCLQLAETQQTLSCNLKPCYSFEQWTEWSPCSVTCGTSPIYRRRRCVSSDGNKVQSNFCSDLHNKPRDVKQCNLGRCNGCPNLSPPENGHIIGSDFSAGKTISYGCDVGFILIGPASRKCLSGGKWSGYEPKCMDPGTCGQPHHVDDPPFSSRAFEGTASKKGAWPWHAFLFVPIGTISAGGSIISNKWILTAQHLFRFRSSEKYLIALGMTNLRKPDRAYPSHVHIYEVGQLYRHQKYGDEVFHDYDVALIRIGKRMKQVGNKLKFVPDNDAAHGVIEFTRYIRPVCLPCMKNNPLGGKQGLLKNFARKKCNAQGPYSSAALTRNDEGRVIVAGFGWKDGRLGAGVGVAPTLQEAILRLLTDKRCKQAAMLMASNRMTCASSFNESFNTNTCGGDGGSPLVTQLDASSKDTKYWALIGIVSWGDNDCSNKLPGYYTSVVAVMPWIMKIMFPTMKEEGCSLSYFNLKQGVYIDCHRNRDVDASPGSKYVLGCENNAGKRVSVVCTGDNVWKPDISAFSCS